MYLLENLLIKLYMLYSAQGFAALEIYWRPPCGGAHPG